MLCQARGLDRVGAGGPGLATAGNFHLPHLSGRLEARGLVTELLIAQGPAARPPAPDLCGGFLLALPVVPPSSPPGEPGAPAAPPCVGSGLEGQRARAGGGGGARREVGPEPAAKPGAFASGLRAPPTGKDSQVQHWPGPALRLWVASAHWVGASHRHLPQLGALPQAALPPHVGERYHHPSGCLNQRPGGFLLLPLHPCNLLNPKDVLIPSPTYA